nr:hypothetical protein [Tanacetum cinerariifolium]
PWRPCAGRGRSSASGADSGLCGDEQHQPGVPAAGSAVCAWRKHRQGLRRIAGTGRRSVLHQPWHPAGAGKRCAGDVRVRRCDGFG